MHEKRLIKPFANLSYLAQVRRLRKYANVVLKKYDLNVSAMDFINHGENANFKVVTKDGSKYLLRIHRNNYHTKDAIQEELSWLKKLSQRKIAVPCPVPSKNKALIETVSVEDLGLSRNCSLFKWVEGKFIYKSLNSKHMYNIGVLLAHLQNNAPKTKHRRYWDADGLLGPNAKFGAIDSLSVASAKQQKLITAARKKTLSKLRRYQIKHPNRLGLIHADFHFGNLLATESGIGAIDFDDCGFGFHIYDLVIPYLSMKNILENRKPHQIEAFKKALIDGYKSINSWDSDDDKIFSDLVAARNLATLGWLDSRSDNPRLKKHLKSAIKSTIKHIRKSGDILP